MCGGPQLVASRGLGKRLCTKVGGVLVWGVHKKGIANAPFRLLLGEADIPPTKPSKPAQMSPSGTSGSAFLIV